MKILSIAAGLALLGLSGATLAAEPIQLSDVALDSVSAGVNGFSVGTTTGSFAFGTAGRIAEKSTSDTLIKTVYDGNKSTTTFRTTSTAKGSTWSAGPGLTGSGGGGAVYAFASK